MSPIVVAALYKFTPLMDLTTWKQRLETLCKTNGIKGTLLLAPEGINGTVAGTRQGIDALKTLLFSEPLFEGIEYKESFANEMPFLRLKVRLKSEIVTLRVKEANPTERVGTYLNPQQWNELLQDPEVVVVDTRNDYEVAIGTFRGAINPKTKCFTELPQFVKENLEASKKRKIAMFCTGGIRCEKSTALMKHYGFEEVYHLKGGILKYLEEVPQEQSLWEGECFVFDQRVAVGHGLELGHYDLCHGCRMPITAQDKESADFEEGVSCPHCAPTLSPEKRQRLRERQRQIMLAKQRGQHHLGQRDGWGFEDAAQD
ncbi:MAG: rhodanese-related sulfurtransferase [Holosporales bacterium]